MNLLYKSLVFLKSLASFERDSSGLATTAAPFSYAG
jgi:hypothetical protein